MSIKLCNNSTENFYVMFQIRTNFVAPYRLPLQIYLNLSHWAVISQTSNTQDKYKQTRLTQYERHLKQWAGRFVRPAHCLKVIHPQSDSANPLSGITEHPHPWWIFFPVIRMPWLNRRTENALRMRHHDGKATILISIIKWPSWHTLSQLKIHIK